MNKGETMKKLYVLFLLFFALPALASGIASNSATAPCTNTTLETYSGNTNLAADWQPNTINLRWYNNNTLLDVQSAANTCVYDGTLTVPSTAPNRTGYTFAGWEVRPQMDFGTIANNNIDRYNSESWGHGYYQTDSCCYRQNLGTCLVISCHDPNIIELERHEWKVKFNIGTLYGMGYCSAKTGNSHNETYTGTISDWLSNKSELDSATGEKKYCWCKTTGYKEENNNTIKRPSSTLLCVYSNEIFSATGCAHSCADYCGAFASRYSGFRTALFTPAAN